MLIQFSVFQTSESCIKLHAVVVLELLLSEMQRTHFTAGYTLYNCVCEKKKKKMIGYRF